MTSYALYVYYTIKNMSGGRPALTEDSKVEAAVGRPKSGGELMLGNGERVLTFVFSDMASAQAAQSAAQGKGYKAKVKRVG